MAQTVEEVFKTGSTLHIEFSDKIGQVQKCTAVIKNIIKGLKEDKFYLEFNEKELAAHITQGAELTLSYQGNDRQIHKFGTYVTEQMLNQNQPLLLAKPMSVDYTSFRRFFRVDVDLPFNYSLNEKKIEGTVTNLSGCGLLAVVEPNRELKAEGIIHFEFWLPANPKPYQLEGKIVRVEMVGNPIKQGIALDFQDINKYDQTEIVVYLAKLQQESGSK